MPCQVFVGSWRDSCVTSATCRSRAHGRDAAAAKAPERGSGLAPMAPRLGLHAEPTPSLLRRRGSSSIPSKRTPAINYTSCAKTLWLTGGYRRVPHHCVDCDCLESDLVRRLSEISGSHSTFHSYPFVASPSNIRLFIYTHHALRFLGLLQMLALS